MRLVCILFLHRYGELNITITVKKQQMQMKKRQMLFRKFLLDYMYENWYLTNTVPLEMMGDFPVNFFTDCILLTISNSADDKMIILVLFFPRK